MRNATESPLGDAEQTALAVCSAIFYIGLICCCVTVGPRALWRALRVKDPTWPDVDRAPWLHLCGWGIGGPVTARCICTVSEFIVDIN